MKLGAPMCCTHYTCYCRKAGPGDFRGSHALEKVERAARSGLYCTAYC